MSAGFLPTAVEKLGDPFVDVGNLLIIDKDPFPDDNKIRVPTEEELLERTRDNTQYLLNKIWELDTEIVEDAIVVKLPKPSLRLPREKVLPAKREQTKWERYAQEKGLRKRKKDSKVFDDATQEWKPRYGYRRGKDDTKDWLIEIPDHKDPMVDYFAERVEAKKERVSKNEVQRLRNIARQTKSKGVHDESVPSGVTVDLHDRNKHQLIGQINRAKFATASHGKFQETLKNEVTPRKTGKTHKYAANETSSTVERKRQMEIFDKISSKKPKLDESRLSTVQRQKTDSQQTPGKQEKRKGKGGERGRHKSAVHRQQHFELKVKGAKKKRGNVRPPAGGAKRGRRKQ